MFKAFQACRRRFCLLDMFFVGKDMSCKQTETIQHFPQTFQIICQYLSILVNIRYCVRTYLLYGTAYVLPTIRLVHSICFANILFLVAFCCGILGSFWLPRALLIKLGVCVSHEGFSHLAQNFAWFTFAFSRLVPHLLGSSEPSPTAAPPPPGPAAPAHGRRGMGLSLGLGYATDTVHAMQIGTSCSNSNQKSSNVFCRR